MISKEDLKVFLVSDTGGKDDEGMKKIARMLAKSFREIPGVNARVVSVREAVLTIKNADILHYIGGPTYRSVLIAAWCKWQNKRIRTILTFSNPQWNWMADLLIRNFSPDCVIVSSTYWQGWANKMELPSELLVVSGVDLKRFVPVSASEKKKLRWELGLPINKIIVLHVGHLKEDRNLIELLKVQRHPDIQVVIVGSTTTVQSDELVQQLEAMGCIVIKRYQPKIETFYQAADCYVFPTIDHKAAVQIPLSILEAMATNLPVITSRFGGVLDFFPETKSFTYLSVDQFDDLANIIKATVATQSNTNSYVQSFAWERIAERLYGVYQKICEELN